ncbi:MAG TPA: alkaline phosphatase family protein [Candidatus Scybalocola faecavium]|nr:alkaline phosphatase family protein [Candidatus Scybalocola faecavium]
MYNTISMTQFAASIADAMNVQPPEMAQESAKVIQEVIRQQVPEGADRVMIYNPDAVGMWLFQKYTEDFAPVLKNVQLGIPVKTVMPSVTPVCFGTMYTGVLPQVHGIMKYEKHVITTDSLFDALPRQGKKAAIVAVEGSSMAIIFGGRNVDYYILPYDEDVTNKALELIKEDRYDLIAVYNQEYDDQMHATGVESEASMKALHNHIESFDRLAKAVKENWKNHNSLVCWATDHGIHQMENGHGNHGEDIEADMNVMHFYGVYPRR